MAEVSESLWNTRLPAIRREDTVVRVDDVADRPKAQPRFSFPGKSNENMTVPTIPERPDRNHHNFISCRYRQEAKQ